MKQNLHQQIFKQQQLGELLSLPNVKLYQLAANYQLLSISIETVFKQNLRGKTSQELIKGKRVIFLVRERPKIVTILFTHVKFSHQMCSVTRMEEGCIFGNKSMKVQALDTYTLGKVLWWCNFSQSGHEVDLSFVRIDFNSALPTQITNN